MTLVLPADAGALLERLTVDPAARAEALAARPDPVAHPVLWAELERRYDEQLDAMGRGVPIDGWAGWPLIPADAGVVGRHLYVWLYLALVPHVRAFHAERGILDDVSWTALAELGDSLRSHLRLFGEHGVGGFSQWSLPLRFRGAEYALGRLAYNRVAIALANGQCGFALNVHIPASGPLDPTACDDSIERALEFAARHFPEEPLAFLTCSSWLMDPQLAEYLPETSNIVAFQRRFQLVPHLPKADETRDDRDVLEYVFGRMDPVPLEKLPRDTTLRRAYVTHLRAGRHWKSRTGYQALT
ncbi:acyltransferase domain-containing protein [Tenggerimyces flavus]|uniref:Acyltransferase domain-containing protein n=1 Tax=Tenggerimyces flavus TaxID=1708749 RepID=A0ABV7YMS9_9ACTN|nr:acyltransferase domain-containing protein [Tenggerimyces flavus]MBM7788764.1 hypothetical protein [Tenggerimyces flavus]